MKNAFNSSTAVLANNVQTALGGTFGQQGRIMTVSTVVGPDALLAEGLRATEGLSEGFSVDVVALSLDAAILLK